MSSVLLKVLVIGMPVVGTLASVLGYASDRSKSYLVSKRERITGVKFARPTILLIQYGTGLVSILSWTWRPEFLLVPYQSVQMVLAGLLVGLLGLGLFRTARRTLAANYSPCFHAYVPNGITTSGIYRVIRHPIYTANMLMVVAGYLVSGSLLMLVMLAMLVTLYVKSARIEEAALSEQFPEYRTYLASTGRFFPRFFSQELDAGRISC